MIMHWVTYIALGLLADTCFCQGKSLVKKCKFLDIVQKGGTRLRVLLAMARNLSIGTRCNEDSAGETSSKKG